MGREIYIFTRLKTLKRHHFHNIATNIFLYFVLLTVGEKMKFSRKVIKFSVFWSHLKTPRFWKFFSRLFWCFLNFFWVFPGIIIKKLSYFFRNGLIKKMKIKFWPIFHFRTNGKNFTDYNRTCKVTQPYIFPSFPSLFKLSSWLFRSFSSFLSKNTNKKSIKKPFFYNWIWWALNMKGHRFCHEFQQFCTFS